jgi:hypothetical protein
MIGSNKMKKEISISLLALGLVACGGGSSSNDGDTAKSNGSSEISISSYSSAGATDASPVGTWIAVLSGTHFTNDIKNSTYQSREIFTIEEQGDNYIINSCDVYQPNASISKTDFLTAQSKNEANEDYSEQYIQTFTSNINFTSSLEYTEKVFEEANMVEKWIESASAIKVSDTTNIQENISISSQNSDLQQDKIEINCLSLKESSAGFSNLEVNSVDNIEIILENDAINTDHIVYFSSNDLKFEDSAEDTGVDISHDVTNNTVDNYAITTVYSGPSQSGTFNISVDFK